MSHESLITALQTLYDSYSKKQKAAQNLIGALKGKSSALGKIQQAVGSYVETGNSDPTLTPVQQLLGNAQEASTPLVQTLTRDVKTLTTFTGALKAAISALNVDPVDVVKLSRPYETLRAIEIRDEQFAAILPELTQKVEQAQEALATIFGASLRNAFAVQGPTVAGSGSKFEVGRFEIAVNIVGRSASISYGKEVVVRRVALSNEAILKAYQSISKSITGRNENPEQWMMQFHTAWNIARQKRDAANQRANIIDCYFEMVMQRQAKGFFITPTKTAFAEYSRAQFAYDLFEIATRPQRDYQGLVVFAHVATKSQTDSAGRSMWIVEGQGPHDGRYIGDIVFDKNE